MDYSPFTGYKDSFGFRQHQALLRRRLIATFLGLFFLLMAFPVSGDLPKRIKTIFVKEEGMGPTYWVKILVVEHTGVSNPPVADPLYADLLVNILKRGFIKAEKPLEGEVLAICTTNTAYLNYFPLACRGPDAGNGFLQWFGSKSTHTHLTSNELLDALEFYFVRAYGILEV